VPGRTQLDDIQQNAPQTRTEVDRLRHPLGRPNLPSRTLLPHIHAAGNIRSSQPVDQLWTQAESDDPARSMPAVHSPQVAADRQRVVGPQGADMFVAVPAGQHIESAREALFVVHSTSF
jgi:hypothetical protein